MNHTEQKYAVKEVQVILPYQKVGFGHTMCMYYILHTAITVQYDKTVRIS
jgi:hypothetical protein